MTNLMWHGKLPPELDEVEKTVIEDIEQNLESVEEPSKLIFHHVFLTNDYKGPSVLVWGNENDNVYYHCEYHPTTQWSSLDDVEDIDSTPERLYK